MRTANLISVSVLLATASAVGRSTAAGTPSCDPQAQLQRLATLPVRERHIYSSQ